MREKLRGKRKKKLLSNPIKITAVFAEEVSRLPLTKKRIRSLIEMICTAEGVTYAVITSVFVGSERMRDLNNKYLSHDYPTDVLAFNLNEENEALNGEIYICVDTAYSQALDYKVPFVEELTRLIVHGILHLIGYDDKMENEQKKMLDLGEDYVRNFLKKDKQS